jgi:beta-glucanase (GH16 family)
MARLMIRYIGCDGTALSVSVQVTTPSIFQTRDPADQIRSYALNVYSDVNSEKECYQPSQTAIVPGTGLVETAIVQSISCNGFTLPYTSGAIVMAPPFTFLYGTVEFKAKVAGCTGCWPAIWMLGYLCQPSAPTIYNASTCDWPNPGADEIDITELLDSNFTSVNQQIHTSSSNAGCRATTTDTSKNFHVQTRTNLAPYPSGSRRRR